ncbi:hypothetical protein ACFXTO_033074 [Malus domestica]
MGIPTSSATSIAKHINIPSITIQRKGGSRRRVEPSLDVSSSFLVREMSSSRRNGLIVDLSDAPTSCRAENLRPWSGGRPSGIDSKWRVGKRAERASRWVKRLWLCLVMRKVTWMPAWQSSCAKLSMGVKCPCDGKGSNTTCEFCCCCSISTYIYPRPILCMFARFRKFGACKVQSFSES